MHEHVKLLKFWRGKNVFVFGLIFVSDKCRVISEFVCFKRDIDCRYNITKKNHWRCFRFIKKSKICSTKPQQVIKIQFVVAEQLILIATFSSFFFQFSFCFVYFNWFEGLDMCTVWNKEIRPSSVKKDNGWSAFIASYCCRLFEGFQQRSQNTFREFGSCPTCRRGQNTGNGFFYNRPCMIKEKHKH